MLRENGSSRCGSNCQRLRFYLAVMNLARDGKLVATVVQALLNAIKRQGDAISALGARIVELAA